MKFNFYKYTPLFCKAGIAAMIFSVGVLPLSAQDMDEEEEVEEAPKKQQPLKIKKYPMKSISGRVVDATTGEALAGVRVRSYNNSFYAAMTDENGEYTINVPTFVTSLSAQAEGYNLVQVAINDRSEGVEIKLFEDRFVADYVAKTTAARITGTSDFSTTSAMTIDQEIQNRLGADVRSISRSGIPGSGVNMFINGYQSLNLNSQPLVVIDGVVYDMLYDSQMFHNGYFNNLLLGLNMDDISDVKVMKNGTALYGAKAANGVILISTKRNTSMTTRIDVNINGSYELIPSTPDVMNADQYRSYASGLLKTTGTKLETFKFLQTDPDYPFYNKYHNDTDWKDISYENAFAQNYGIHIQGGDEVANYNLSVGYMQANSVLKKNDVDRFNIRFNSDIILTDKMNTRFDVSYSNLKRNLRDDGFASNYPAEAVSSPNVLALIKSPFVAPYDFANNGDKSHFIADADDYLDEALGKTVAVANPLGILHYGDAPNKNKVDNTFVNITIAPKYTINRDLSVTETFSYTSQSFSEAYYTPVQGMPRYYIESVGNVENAVGSNFSKHNAVMSDTRVNWLLPLGAHRFDLMGGVRYLNDSYTASRLFGYSSSNDKDPELKSSLKNKTINGTDDQWLSLGYYAQVDYSFREKYYLQGTLTAETSSRFGKDADAGIHLFGVTWGIFPSIQGAWTISNEDWFHPTSAVNMLKVNAGFEVLGNDGSDNNAAFTYMGSRNFLRLGESNKGVTGIGIENIGNSKLRWEQTSRFNAGVEGNFFNDRLNVKLNYFNSKTNNLITLGSIAYLTGLQTQWTNGGALKNEGFDVALNAKVVNKNKVKLIVGGSVGHYKNKITSLPEGYDGEHNMYQGTVLSQVGSPVGVFYGYETEKRDGKTYVFSTTAEAEAADLGYLDAANNKIPFVAGDVKFVDRNGDNIISKDDRTVIGDPNPDFYGNIHANLFLGKHLSLGVTFNYCVGNDIYNFQRSVLEGSSAFLNQTTAVSRRWIAERQITDMPQAVYRDPHGNSRFSDRWIEDGSYLKLKNVTLSYKVPVKNTYIMGLTLWGAANNLYTLTKYLGSDPEFSCGQGVLTQGIDAGFTPAGRNFSLGVTINL